MIAMATPIEQPQQPNPELERGISPEAALPPGPPVLESGSGLGDQSARQNGESAPIPALDGHQLNGEAVGSNGMDHGGSAESNEPAADLGPLDLSKLELAESPVPLAAVKIKGRPGGVAVEIGEGGWDDLIKLLEIRLAAAEGFFRGGRVVLELGPRSLVTGQVRQVQRILENHEMQLGVVRSTSERTLQAAQEIGLSTSSDEQDSFHEPDAPLPEEAPLRPGHYVHRGNLRSGQILRKTESIVIIGDVNPGAQVISGGDIMIWGRLRGVAFAGADGNRKAVVAALEFAPTQLRIAHLTSIAPEQKKGRGLRFWKQAPERHAEIARIVESRIVVEPWDDSKPGGPTILYR
jgi:septum site-determining protein MinC